MYNIFNKPGYTTNEVIKELQSKIADELNDQKIREAVKRIQENPLDLRYLDTDLQNNFRVVSEAVARNGDALRYASKVLKNNKEIVLLALRNSSSAYQYVGSSLLDDFEVRALSNRSVSNEVESKVTHTFTYIFPAVEATKKQSKKLSFLNDNENQSLINALSLDTKKITPLHRKTEFVRKKI